MVRRTVASFIAALVVVGTSAAAGPAVAGPNHKLNGEPEAARQHVYPDVEIDPSDPDHLVVVDGDQINWRCSVYVSLDRGGSWTSSRLPLPADLPSDRNGCIWPSASIARDGTVYVSYSTDRNRLAGDRLYVTRSDDGGLTFGDPVRVDAGIRAWTNEIEVDNSGAARDGTVYVAWFQLATTDQGRNMWIVSSVDGGATFSAPTRVNDLTRPIGGRVNLAIGPHGQVNVLFMDATPFLATVVPEALLGVIPPAPVGTFNVMFDSSTDGGQTFGLDVLVDFESPATLVAKDQTSIALPVLDVDPTTGRMYAVWADRRHGDWDVIMRTSDDAGATWSPARRVNADPAGNGVEQLMPWVDIAPDGTVTIAWQDRRRDPDNRRNELLLAHSHDGGATFTETFVSDAPSRGDIGGSAGIPGTKYQGDMVGLAAWDGFAVAAWPDARNGTPEDDINDLYGAVVELEEA